MVAPRPYNPNGPETFDLSSDFDMTGGGLLWYGRLQLLFRCTLCPTGARDRSLYREVSLAFFSTFEPVELTPDSIMQRQGVPMLYDSASCSALPSLYICHVKNILGRVPMIPCFVEGNSQPTIPHSFRRHELAGGAADTRPDTGPTAATAAACMRSICGCGATVGDMSARCPSWRPWRNGQSAFVRRGRQPAKRESADG